MYLKETSSCSCDEAGQEKALVATRSCRWCCNVTARYRRRLSELCSHLRSALFHTPSTFCRVALTCAHLLKMLQLSSSSAVTLSRGSCKLLNIRLGGLLPCSEAGEAGEAAEVDDLIIDHGCAACHCDVEHWSAASGLVLAAYWQLQDISD